MSGYLVDRRKRSWGTLPSVVREPPSGGSNILGRVSVPTSRFERLQNPKAPGFARGIVTEDLHPPGWFSFAFTALKMEGFRPLVDLVRFRCSLDRVFRGLRAAFRSRKRRARPRSTPGRAQGYEQGNTGPISCLFKSGQPLVDVSEVGPLSMG